jgi:hypothetical protein
MNLPEFLASLTNEEREFISGLDYHDRQDEHRKALDRVIERNGNIDLETELWCPYEVIELGKNWRQDSHEREFVACAAIVLHNIIKGVDEMNDVEISMSVVMENFIELKIEHQKLLEPLLTQAMEMD